MAAKPTSDAPPQGNRGGCVCGAWRALGDFLHSACEPGPEEEEPAYVRLQRMHEERNAELEAIRVKAASALESDRLRALSWGKEIEALQERRENMTAEELNEDCLSYFASATILKTPEQPIVMPREEVIEIGGAQEETPESAPKNLRDVEPDGFVELWLKERFGSFSDTPDEVGKPHACESKDSHPQSPGELPSESCLSLAADLVKTLLEGAGEDDRLVNGLQTAEGLDQDEFEELIAKYEVVELSDEEANSEDGPEKEVEELTIGQQLAAQQAAARGHRGVIDSMQVAEDPDDVFEWERHVFADAKPDDSTLNYFWRYRGESMDANCLEEEASARRQRAQRHQAVGERLALLVPILENDSASTRLAAALALRDAGGAPTNGPDAMRRCWSGVSGTWRAPMMAISTADACWALCSEKQRLVIERLLPSVAAPEGRWAWPDLRLSGVGWWLSSDGSGLEVLDAIVAKLTQSAVAQLKRARRRRERQKASDEVVFWYFVQGTTLARMRTLIKTGLFDGQKELAVMFEHARCGEESFTRKNAFRLLQLHRFYLAAALFILIGNYEDAAKVIVSHLQDLQLMRVVTRRQQEVARPLMLEELQESPIAKSDPWLRFLLAWHGGDLEAAQMCGHGDSPDQEDSELALFDGTLRPSSCHEPLEEVIRMLLEPESKPTPPQVSLETAADLF
eukprot:gnl/TRDRNA2_/TRDRNA2_40922_c0_seq1.p1 gnl/TRDRNA2_/TRDRNA2_40922_c0~~gnl/TRDRNA2_/TRDRNA2_40922_c0_seq1.p1  ORF type:complete len:683 (-),score=149.56 gnl/TRDRNA2_/TRDRNA2_40922_c0_seq1:33-2081(-)